MSQDAIIEKIKKLLRMKRGGTAGEIANALAMAAELARKHGIDLAAVDPDAPEAKPITHADVFAASRLQQECKYAALVCQNFFNVTALMVGGRGKVKIAFIGTESDRLIATYIWEFLVRHFRRCWNKRDNRRLRNRAAFMHGIYTGLCHKLHVERQQVTGTGLMRLDQQLVRRDQYLKNTFGETEKKDVGYDGGADGSRYAGYAAGRRTEIRPAVSGTAAPPRRELPAPRPANPQLSLL